MTPYRQTSRTRARKAARRQRLLAVATRLFGEYGFHATTVPRIVEEAGSSTGSFYFYFANKEDIFATVLRDVGDRLADALNRAIERENVPANRMRAAVAGTFRFLADNPGDARILIVESSGLTTDLEAVRRQLHDSHARSVERALANASEGRISDDPAVLARCWIGAVYEAVRWWLDVEPSARPTADRMGEIVAGFNLRGTGLG